MSERTVLYDLQRQAGAKIIDFHGWEMPVQFTGIVPEHVAVRTTAGAFDLCHMGRIQLDGPGATAFLGHEVCRPSADMLVGQVRYGMVLAEDGTIEDDVLISREGADTWHVVVNASNTDKILGLWQDRLPTTVRCRDLSSEQAMIAVQGPNALSRLSALGLDASGLKYYAFADRPWRGTVVRLSRTGYTGEDGCECFLPSSRAADLWTALMGVGVTPCGLGCRDTLRLEAGMPLYGNELDRSATPVEAGLAFAVGKRGGYRGDAVILQQLASGGRKRLVGLRMREKRVPRSQYPVNRGASVVGSVTSGTLSPTLGQAIGMAYVAIDCSQPGTELAVDIRGQIVPAEVVALPFYRRAR